MTDIRVLLADDHAMVRSGIALLIGAQPDMEVVGEAETGDEAQELAARHGPDVVVLDISMPGGSGIQAIEGIHEASPSSAILMLTMHDDQAYLRAAVAAGASGYVVKAAADKELLSAIRTLHQGRTYLSVSFGGSGEVEKPEATPALLDPPRREHGDLSRRETQVLEFVAYGYTSQQIADKLGLSIKTVDGYRARLTEKLALKNRADLVRYALEQGILDANRPLPGDVDAD